MIVNQTLNFELNNLRLTYMPDWLVRLNNKVRVPSTRPVKNIKSHNQVYKSKGKEWSKKSRITCSASKVK